jgi:hypothetical protein
MYWIKKLRSFLISIQSSNNGENVMNHKKINFISVILFSIVIAGLLSVRAYADTETKESQSATASVPQAAIEKPVPIKTEYIDKAGDAIGKSVDSMSGKASTRMGGWINSRIYADITWFKPCLSGWLPN